ATHRFLGRPDQALDRMEEALTLARDLSEPHGLARALFFAAILHQLRREALLAGLWAAECGSDETLPSHGRPSWVLLRTSRVTVSTSMAFPTSTFRPIKTPTSD